MFVLTAPAARSVLVACFTASSALPAANNKFARLAVDVSTCAA